MEWWLWIIVAVLVIVAVVLTVMRVQATRRKGRIVSSRQPRKPGELK